MFWIYRLRCKPYLCIIIALCCANAIGANVSTVDATIEKKQSLTQPTTATEPTSIPSQATSSFETRKVEEKPIREPNNQLNNPQSTNTTNNSLNNPQPNNPPNNPQSTNTTNNSLNNPQPTNPPNNPQSNNPPQTQPNNPPQTQPNNPPNNVFSNIKILMGKKQLEEAKSLAIEYLKTNPNDGDVMLLLGLIYYQQSAYEQAEQAFHKVLEKTPNYLDATLGLIRVKLAEKKYKEASDLINQAVKQAPNNPEVKQVQLSYQKAVSSIEVAKKPSGKPNIQPEMFSRIKILMKQKKLTEAKSLAIEHLKQYPNDLDVMLLLGLIEYQQSAYKQAELLFHKVLEKSPSYLDAKLGLIRIKIAQKQYKEASSLIKEVRQKDPQNKELKEIEILYQKAIQEKKKGAIKKKVEKPSLIDEEISKNHLFSASAMVRWCLRIYPNNPRLLVQKAKILSIKHLYAQSAFYTQKALAIDPGYAPAKENLGTLMEISPNKLYGLNEIGLYSLNEYVSDLHEIWDYSTFYYSRETEFGQAYARINYAKRLGNRAPQGELEFLPVITRDLYFDLYASFANKPELFPKYALAIEGYLTYPKLFTLSFGHFYAFIIKSTYYNKYTVSLSKEINKYWLSMRVNHYVPNAGSESTLYLGTIRRYLKTNDCYINLSFGFGRSPDLADLSTLDFLVIENKFVNLGIRFPICNHRILVDLIADYQNWKYPSGLVRELSGGTVGLSYRF